MILLHLSSTCKYFLVNFNDVALSLGQLPGRRVSQLIWDGLNTYKRCIFGLLRNAEHFLNVKRCDKNGL